ncbi:COBRA-like protein 7 [Ananas comosus]|uniref:COBRA-like protein n=1 Tax=Ananas comosus TaxID=4615 RepID=A0A199W7Y3_ANACO|nr:COBRA-like protein 7 [Ananas comosus]
MEFRSCSIIHMLESCFLLLIIFQFAEGYDPVDPNGNITINWDFQTITDVYTVMVRIYNFQLYRHVEPPGWRLSWAWAGDEVIWAMTGAETTEQGSCSRFRGETIPHCCEKSPVIVDLPPGTPYNMQVANCCRGGVLSSTTQDPIKYASAFQMVVGNANARNSTVEKPSNFSIGVPGYTCSDAVDVAPSKFRHDNRRTTQALKTWQITCSYSQFRESDHPSCCVSLSTFYNNTIVSCPHCSCGCQSPITAPQCVRQSPFPLNSLFSPLFSIRISSYSSKYRENEQPNFLHLLNGDDGSTTLPVVMCTQHMCPIRVHWHLKLNYREYWRVKVTITNFSVRQNYSNWNLVIQHPNLRSLTQVFSFNYRPLIQYGDTNDTGMFWGIQYYNDMLLESGENGNVQTEMLLQKDPAEFTFKGGWAFPRRIYFNGHECVMPPPDTYPILPSGCSDARRFVRRYFGMSSLLLFFALL